MKLALRLVWLCWWSALSVAVATEDSRLDAEIETDEGVKKLVHRRLKGVPRNSNVGHERKLQSFRHRKLETRHRELQSFRHLRSDAHERRLNHSPRALQGAPAFADGVKSSAVDGICEHNPGHRICKAEAGNQHIHDLLESRKVRRERFPKHSLSDKEMKDIDIVPFLFSDKMDDYEVEDPTDISLVTHFNLDESKLQRLLDLTSRWGGLIAAVVYIDIRENQVTQEDLLKEIQNLIDFHEKNKEALARVNFHLAIDQRASEEEELFYPHNLLRNLAVDLAETDQVFVSDVDFIPSKGSHKILKSQWSALDVSSNPKKLLILPAFERFLAEGESETMLTSRDLPPTKKALIKEIKGGKDSLYDTFHSHYEVGHGATLFEYWYKSKESYKIDYELFFEPYFVLQRNKDLPMFWEHFTGFGRNKQSWVEELGVAGYEFNVNSGAFLIHIDHDHKSSRVTRPSVIHEYIDVFQAYLHEKYPDKTYWDEEALEAEAQGRTTAYYKKIAAEKI